MYHYGSKNALMEELMGATATGWRSASRSA